MASSATTLIFLFVGVFLLLMVVYAGIAAPGQNYNSNTSDTQNTQAEQDTQNTEMQKPILMGLGGFQMILLVLLILGGIGIFLKAIFGKRSY